MESTSVGSDSSFLHIPFAKRWEYHKPAIRRMYIDEQLTVNDIMRLMKEQHRFDADVRQYKYHLKKWGLSKSVPASVKDAAIRAGQKRVRSDTAVGGIRWKGEKIDPKKLRRHLKTIADEDWQLTATVFGQWSLPHQAFTAPSWHETNTSSPFGVDHSTPSDMSVCSPLSVGPSPRDVMSPGKTAVLEDSAMLTMDLRAKTYDDRARSLIQGRVEEILKDMPATEKRAVTTWLYQFWLFSFKTAKYWGKGPTRWSPELLQFMDFTDASTIPNTPTAFSDGMLNQPSPVGNHDRILMDAHRQVTPEPSSLCSWSIHYLENLPYEETVSPPPERQQGLQGLDMDDPDSWPRWPHEETNKDVTERLRQGLEDNAFSNIDAADLPLSTKKISEAASASPVVLRVEAIGFAIMARNLDALQDLLESSSQLEDYDTTLGSTHLAKLFPLHLAASFFDGAHTCCNIIGMLTNNKYTKYEFKNLYVNDLGHTVLDSLMMTILKSHTSCAPAAIDARLKKYHRFPGDDVSTCGRWDADSPCVRRLNAKGESRIPLGWKHIFCHTSAQAVCHSIAVLFTHPYSPDVNTPSGLFERYCSHCESKLQLLPLHTLVLTAFYLANYGRPGETLFGILAVLVCLLAHGADPRVKCAVSITALLGDDDTREACTHLDLDPVELAEQVPFSFQANWAPDARLGWQVFVEVLRFAQRERGSSRRYGCHARTGDGEYEDDEDDEDNEDNEGVDCEHEEWFQNCYGGSPKLGMLWASIQTELLTYRRDTERDPWLSDNMAMVDILQCLQDDYTGGLEQLPLVRGNMMRSFCACGRFVDAHNPVLVTTEEACKIYFSNLEDWSRSTYLRMPCDFE